MDNINSINNFFYFIKNVRFVKHKTLGEFVPEFLCAWNDPHLLEKWNEVNEESDELDSAIINFYAQLDNKNRRIMLEWIENNYDCGLRI